MSILLAWICLRKARFKDWIFRQIVPWCTSCCVFVCVYVCRKKGSDGSNPFKQPSGPEAWHLSTSAFLASSPLSLPLPLLLFLLLSPPSKLGAPGCLQPACTGLLIGNRAAAHLLIESRLGPWGRAVKQAPRGIKSWRLTGHCKSRAANSGGVYPSVLELKVCVCPVCVCLIYCMCAHVRDVNACMVRVCAS